MTQTDIKVIVSSQQFLYLPAGEFLDAQLMLYEVSVRKRKKEEFSQLWLTPATIKDALWTSRNLLARRRMQIPPVAMLRMAAAMVNPLGAGCQFFLSF